MISLESLQYDLPDEQIARFPLKNREDARLLVYRNGQILHDRFASLPNQLPENSLLIFNNSKVIPARLVFHKSTGARIEVLLLQPCNSDPLHVETVQNGQTWEAMIGNRKKWKSGEPLILRSGNSWLQAEPDSNAPSLVRLSWSSDFMDLLSALQTFGAPPLPPYLNREAGPEDQERYQTVFSRQPGSVAAPTAGLHFTDNMISRLREKGIRTAEITLHVGAGTFLPIKTHNVLEHTMHREFFEINRQNLKIIHAHDGPIIPVGTTATRCLETLYSATGIPGFSEMASFPLISQVPVPHQTERKTAIRLLLDWMQRNQLDACRASTGIYITPGYHFGFSDALITNFHQPGSTLLLLVSAFVGSHWQNIYNEAIREKYRFLSYGDTSLLWRNSRF